MKIPFEHNTGFKHEGIKTCKSIQETPPICDIHYVDMLVVEDYEDAKHILVCPECIKEEKVINKKGDEN